MWHWQSEKFNTAACGAKILQSSLQKLHNRVTCPKCILLIHEMIVQCNMEGCRWSGPVEETLMGPIPTKRACPKCAEKEDSRGRPILSYIVDEFGIPVTLPRLDIDGK